MSDTKTILINLTDAWALHALCKGASGPWVLGRSGSEVHYFLRKLQDIILALTFPKGAASIEEIAEYGAAAGASADAKALALTFEEAWLIVSNVSRTSYETASRVLLQVFRVLQQFSGYDAEMEPEPDTELPSWMPDFTNG